MSAIFLTPILHKPGRASQSILFDFLVQNRNAYLRLSKIAGGLTVVPPLAIDKVKDVVVECASRLFGVAPALDAFSIAKLPKAQTQSVRMEPL